MVPTFKGRGGVQTAESSETTYDLPAKFFVTEKNEQYVDAERLPRGSWTIYV